MTQTECVNAKNVFNTAFNFEMFYLFICHNIFMLIYQFIKHIITKRIISRSFADHKVIFIFVQKTLGRMLLKI